MHGRHRNLQGSCEFVRFEVKLKKEIKIVHMIKRRGRSALCLSRLRRACAFSMCSQEYIYYKLFYINTRHKKPTTQTHIIARENKTISILNEHDYSRALFHLRQGTQRALLFDSFSLSLFLPSALSFLSLENRENRIPFLGEEPQKLEFSFTHAARFLSFLLSFFLSLSLSGLNRIVVR